MGTDGYLCDAEAVSMAQKVLSMTSDGEVQCRRPAMRRPIPYNSGAVALPGVLSDLE